MCRWRQHNRQLFLQWQFLASAEMLLRNTSEGKSKLYMLLPMGLRTVTNHTRTRQKKICYIKSLLSSYSSGIYSKERVWYSERKKEREFKLQSCYLEDIWGEESW